MKQIATLRKIGPLQPDPHLSGNFDEWWQTATAARPIAAMEAGLSSSPRPSRRAESRGENRRGDEDVEASQSGMRRLEQLPSRPIVVSFVMVGLALPLTISLSLQVALGLENGATVATQPAEATSVQAAAVHVPNLNGSWAGTWQSRCSGHKGPLKATFCYVGCNQYEVHFRGRFCKLLPFCYTVNLRVTGCEEGKVYLSGSHKLPLFGTFTFSAWATDTQFCAGYRAKDDAGTFVMSRCR
jgi:hypothetical protein